MHSASAQQGLRSKQCLFRGAQPQGHDGRRRSRPLGFVLLLVGALSSALVVLDIRLALILLAGMGLAGVIAANQLPEVSAG